MKTASTTQNVHISKIIEGPGRKAAGLANSNSPKAAIGNPGNKLFLKGFHQEH